MQLELSRSHRNFSRLFLKAMLVNQAVRDAYRPTQGRTGRPDNPQNADIETQPAIQMERQRHELISGLCTKEKKSGSVTSCKATPTVPSQRLLLILLLSILPCSIPPSSPPLLSPPLPLPLPSFSASETFARMPTPVH